MDPVSAAAISVGSTLVGSAFKKVASAIAASFQEARLTRKQEETIVNGATTRQVFGGNDSLRRKRDDYAESPIIAHIKKRCSQPAVIYVAYVPNNNGKTSACYAIMDKPYARRAVAFSPDSSHRIPYFDAMVGLLQFDVENPPAGFMRHLLSELEKGEKHPELERNLLILDNFMPLGFNEVDSCFLHNLKAQIKEKNVTALIFTPSREAACRILSQNELGAIVPLAPNNVIHQLRLDNMNKINPKDPLAFDWETEVSMVWDKSELEKAFYHSCAFRQLQEAKQTLMRQTFDTVYNGLSKEAQDKANPTSMFKCFNATQMEITTPRAGAAPFGDDGGCCTCAIS